jgi:Fic family protein
MNHVDLNDLTTHPLFVATHFHQQFLNVIHPFADGNGRIGRIFTNLILIKNGFPPLFITDINRTEYLDCFERSETDPEAMLHFLADRLIESLNLKIDFLSKESPGSGE